MSRKIRRNWTKKKNQFAIECKTICRFQLKTPICHEHLNLFFFLLQIGIFNGNRPSTSACNRLGVTMEELHLSSEQCVQTCFSWPPQNSHYKRVIYQLKKLTRCVIVKETHLPILDCLPRFLWSWQKKCLLFSQQGSVERSSNVHHKQREDIYIHKCCNKKSMC